MGWYALQFTSLIGRANFVLNFYSFPPFHWGRAAYALPKPRDLIWTPVVKRSRYMGLGHGGTYSSLV